MDTSDGGGTVSQETVDWFQRALLVFPENERARWYVVVTRFWRGEQGIVSKASPANERYSRDAFALGNSAKADGAVDKALLWFAVSSHFSNEVGGKAAMPLARLCQHQYAFQSTLLPRSQRLCEPYWHPADGNLLINGQFDLGKAGWVDLIATDERSVVYSVEEGTDCQGPCLRIETRSQGYHGGKFQFLTLPPGTTLSYKVRLKTREFDHLAVDVLVWQAGPIEKRLIRFSGSRGWRVYESSLVIANAGGRTVMFAPVRIWGKGTVWVDDVQLVIAEGKQP